MLSGLAQILIIDNANTCAMRIKLLAQIHGANVDLVHWRQFSEWQNDNQIADVIAVILDESIPHSIAQQARELFIGASILVIIQAKSGGPDWPSVKPLSPIVSTLSNQELVDLLEPYWLEDKLDVLPNLLLLDNDPSSAQLVSNELNRAQVQFQWLVNESWQGFEPDLVLLRITDMERDQVKVGNIKHKWPNAGLIVYGSEQAMISRIGMRLISKSVDEVLFLDELTDELIPRFHRCWQHRLKLQNEKRLAVKIQQSFDRLLEKNLMLQVLFSNSLDGIVAFDSDGVMAKVNEGMCAMLGLTKKELQGQDFLSNLLPDSARQLMAIMRDDPMIQAVNVDLILRHVHQVKIPVTAVINRIRMKDQSIYIAVLRNNVSQAFSKQFIEQQNQRLSYRVQELEQRETLKCQHGLRQAQRRKVFFSHLLKLLVGQDESVANRKLQRVIEILDIEQLSRASGEKRSVGSLSEAIHYAIEATQNAWLSKKLVINYSQNKDSPVRFDSNELRAVLCEILDNSARHSRLGDTITLTLWQARKHSVSLHIADAGGGINEHQQLAMFDLYDANVQSQSIDTLVTGLPFCSAVCRRNGAELQIENRIQNDEVIGIAVTLCMELVSE